MFLKKIYEGWSNGIMVIKLEIINVKQIKMIKLLNILGLIVILSTARRTMISVEHR